MTIKVNTDTAIVFDLDDTLYYELDYLISAYREIALFLDKENAKMLFAKMFSMYRNQLDVFGFLTTEYGVEKTILIEMYRNHYPQIQLSKGVLEVFQRIKAKQGKIGVLTDGRSITQRNKIKALGIENDIDFISISEEVGAEKPNEKPFKNMMTQLQADTYYYIGDNLKKDFIMPNQLNWNSVYVVDNGKNIHINSYLHQDKKHLPKEIIFSFDEIEIV